MRERHRDLSIRVDHAHARAAGLKGVLMEDIALVTTLETMYAKVSFASTIGLWSSRRIGASLLIGRSPARGLTGSHVG
jgi:hypothetical protein